MTTNIDTIMQEIENSLEETERKYDAARLGAIFNILREKGSTISVQDMIPILEAYASKPEMDPNVRRAVKLLLDLPIADFVAQFSQVPAAEPVKAEPKAKRGKKAEAPKEPKASKKAAKAEPKAKKTAKAESSGDENVTDESRAEVLGSLKDPQTKAEIIEATGLDAGVVAATIKALIEDGKVEKTGAGRGTRYQKA